eukprot:IDg8881t1
MVSPALPHSANPKFPMEPSQTRSMPSDSDDDESEFDTRGGVFAPHKTEKMPNFSDLEMTLFYELLDGFYLGCLGANASEKESFAMIQEFLAGEENALYKAWSPFKPSDRSHMKQNGVLLAFGRLHTACENYLRHSKLKSLFINGVDAPPKKNLSAMISGKSISICKRTGSQVAVVEPAKDNSNLEGICAQQNAELLAMLEKYRYSPRHAYSCPPPEIVGGRPTPEMSNLTPITELNAPWGQAPNKRRQLGMSTETGLAAKRD